METTPVVDEALEETPAPPTEAVQERDEQGKFRNPAQPRIDELTRARREAEREADYWRQRAQAKEAQDSAKAAPVEPKEADFTDHNEFLKAAAKFEARKEAQELFKEQQAQADKARAELDKQKAWADRASKAKTAFKDYDDVVSNSDVRVLDHVIKALNDAEEGPALTYHLAKNPELAERLNRLPYDAVNRELGRLEASLSKPEPEPEVEKEDPVPVVRQTRAPPPAKPIPSGRSSVPDLSKMSMEDYTKSRIKQGARWAR